MQTLSFVKKVNFSSVIAIPFSRMANTKAELLEPKIKEKEILVRMKQVKKFMKKNGYHCIKAGACEAIYFEKKVKFFFNKLLT